MQLGGGLSSPSGGYGHEFHAPGEEEAMNVNSLPGGVGNGLDTFKVAVLGASKGVDGGCGYSMVEFQNNVSYFSFVCMGFLTAVIFFIGFANVVASIFAMQLICSW